MKKELELRLLKMCMEILPKTTMRDNKKLKELLDDIHKDLT